MNSTFPNEDLGGRRIMVLAGKLPARPVGQWGAPPWPRWRAGTPAPLAGTKHWRTSRQWHPWALHPRALHPWAVHPWAVRPMVAAGLMLVFVSGCMGPRDLLGMVAPQERQSFRAEAIRCLKEAAFSPEPALRMNAIEALGEVAPQEGLRCLLLNVENEYAGVSFAALMALGDIGSADGTELIRTRAEHQDANVKIAALYALHRQGDKRRTGELGDFLLHDRNARVRANAALVFGRLKEASSAKLLRRALKRERKDLPKLQITEALATLGDKHAIEVLRYHGNSAYPDQATLALMYLGNATCLEAEDDFRDRLYRADFPEVKLAAARGLGRLGFEDGLEVAAVHLLFRSPDTNRPTDPPEQQIARIRGLAALALEAIGSPLALRPLREALEAKGQTPYVRIAIARAAIKIIDLQKLSAVSYQPEGKVDR